MEESQEALRQAHLQNDLSQRDVQGDVQTSNSQDQNQNRQIQEEKKVQRNSLQQSTNPREILNEQEQNYDGILVFFESLKKINFQERINKISALVAEKEYETFNLIDLKDDLELFNQKVKRGYTKFNNQFGSYFQILFDEPKESFSIEDIKQIITGCIIFVETQRQFPLEDQQNLVYPKLLKETYFMFSKYDQFINLEENEEYEDELAYIKKFFKKIHQKKNLTILELIKLVEKENVKKLEKYIQMIEGKNEEQIKILILETAQEFGIEQFFNYLQVYQQPQENVDSHPKQRAFEEEKVSSSNQQNEQSYESQKLGQAPKNQTTPFPIFKNEIQSSFTQLQNFETQDNDFHQILDEIKLQFTQIQGLIKNKKQENYDLKLKSCIKNVKNNLGYFFDEEYEQLNRLINQNAQEMNIVSYFEENQETPKGPDGKQQPELNQYDEFIELQYKNLTIGSEDSIQEFYKQLKKTSFIQETSNFKNKWKMLESVDKNIDQINAKFQRFYPTIFQQNPNNISHEYKEQIVIGCSLYMLAESLVSLQEYKKINKPVFLDVQKLNNQDLKQQKIQEFYNFKVSKNQINFENIVDLMNQIEKMSKSKQQLKDIQDNIEIIEEYLAEWPEKEEKNQLIELINNALFELGIHEKLKTQQALLKQEQEQQIIEQIMPQIVFKDDPFKYIDELIQNKNIYNSKDLEDQIIDMYSLKIEYISQQKIKQFFNQVQEFKNSSQINQGITNYTQKTAQECLDHILVHENCKQLYDLLAKYCSYKIPEIQLTERISRMEKIQKDFKEISQMLPLINTRYTIRDFMTIYTRSKFDSVYIDIQQYFQQYREIEGHNLIFILFDCIKRKIDFNQAIKIFTQLKSDFKITPTTLFTYLYTHCDNKLKIFLFISCSQYMALPISVLNPWDIDENTQIPKRIYFEELLYVFEKQNSILQFKFLSNEHDQSVQDCSQTINKMFGKNFQTHQASSASEGTIEIQFDNNCSTVQYFAVADAHGQLEPEIIENFSQLFDCLIIHTDKSYNQNQKLKDFLEQLIKQNKHIKLILIIVHDQNQNIDTGYVETKISMNTTQIETPKLKDIFKNNLDNFIDKCLKIFEQHFSHNISEYLQVPLKRLDNKKKFLQFLQPKVEEKIYDKHLKSFQILENLLKIIIRQEDFTSLSFLPMVQFSQKKNQIENLLKKESLKMQKEEIEKIEKQYEDLKIKMSYQSLTEISESFLQVIYQDLQLEVLPILSLFVKGYLQVKRDQYEEKIARLQEQIIQPNAQQKIDLEKNIENQKQELEKKIFSQENLIREINELSIFSKFGENLKQEQNKNNIIDKKTFKNFKEAQNRLTYQLIRDSQPTELINGDTNQFISNIYEKLFAGNEKEEVLVISVIGVQSAGKSLLLNFLFGTQFLSSAARCTKGVYGTIIKFESENGQRKKILLLDTEGIQSAEKQDPQFDRKIVFFILSVSHVILLCNKQEMNQDMGEILKLVADQLVNAKQRNVHSPKVFIILNMLNQSSQQIKIECVKKLQKDLAIIDKHKDNESLNQTLQINVNNVFPLQFAFKKENFKIFLNDKPNSVNVPQLEFQNDIFELREAILNSFEQNSKFILFEWFNFAQETWKYTNSLKDLENYLNLEQKKEDKLINEIINDLRIKYYIEGWKNEIKINLDNHLKETEIKFQGGGSISLTVVTRFVQTKIDDIYEIKQKEIFNEFKNNCLLKKISNSMIESRKIQLEKQNTQYKHMASGYSSKQVSNIVSKKFKDVGDSTLQEILNFHIRKDISYSSKHAEQIFDQEAWPKVLKNNSNALQSSDEIQQRDIKNVRDLFSQVIKLADAKFEKYCNSLFEQHGEVYGVFFKLQSYTDENQILLFTGEQKSPNLQKILQFQKQEKKYLTNIPNKIYEEKSLYTYYKWESALEDCLDIEKLSFKIRMCLFELSDYSNLNWYQRAGKGIQNGYNRFTNFIFNNNKQDISEKEIDRASQNLLKVYDIIQILKTELNVLGIKFNGSYQDFIPSKSFENTQREKGIKKTQVIVYENIKALLYSKNKIQIKQLPQENPFYNFSNKQKAFEYLIFEDNGENYEARWIYEQKDYIIQSEYQLDNDNLQYIDHKRNVQITNEMNLKFNVSIKNSLNKYLIYLADSKLNYLLPTSKSDSIKFFLNCLNWRKISKEIEECILNNLYKIQRENNQGNMSFNNIITILKKKDEESIQLKKQFNVLEPKYAKEIIIGVRQIILQINEELDYFCLTIKDTGMNLIYLLAQTATTGLVYNLALVGQIEPLNNIKNKYQNEKKMFIAKLTMNNTEIDNNLGEKLANEYSQKCFMESKEHTVEKFKDQIDGISNQFQNIRQVDKLEQDCLDINQKLIDYKDKNYQLLLSDKNQLSELLDFKINPRQLLEKKFKQKFNQVSQMLIKENMERFKLRFTQQIEKFLNYLKQFLELIQKKNINKTPANMLFVIDKNSPVRLNYEQHEKQFKEYQQLALMQYFKDIIRQKKTQIYKFQNDNVWLKISEDYILPVYTDIHNYNKFEVFNQDLVEAIILENDYITNLHSFVQHTIQSLEIIIKGNIQPQDQQNQQFELKEEDLLEKCQKKLMKMYIGCIVHCPLCRKQCDVDHQEDQGIDDEVHSCQNGHQMQAFGGSKTQLDNKALLIACDELNEKDIINYNGQSFQWKEFKKNQFPSWVFESKNQEHVKLNRQKNVIIWNLIGKQLCQTYNDEGNNIIYHNALMNPSKIYPMTHYMFMLDESGSMNQKKIPIKQFQDYGMYFKRHIQQQNIQQQESTPWEQLIQKFTDFIEILESKIILKENSKISLITYNDSSNSVFEEEIPDSLLIQRIQYRGGNTDFDIPLQNAYHLCKKNIEKYQNIVLYFMSDGKAGLPESGIKKFVDDQDIIKKTKIYTIPFGKNADKTTLEAIANSFPSGKMIPAPTPEALGQSFLQIIPEIYQQ